MKVNLNDLINLQQQIQEKVDKIKIPALSGDFFILVNTFDNRCNTLTKADTHGPIWVSCCSITFNNVVVIRNSLVGDPKQLHHHLS